MSQLPLVSILLPAYNAAAFLAETLDSVLAQDYARWEVLLADDGSTDATPSIAAEYARRDPRIRVFRLEKNTGLAAAARHRAFAESTGELLAFLDADDLWEPTKLSRQVAHLQANPAADAVCTWYTVFGDAERAAQWRRMMWRDASPTIAVGQILNNTPATPTVMVRRSAWERLGGMRVSRRLATGEDREFFVRLVLSGRFDRIPEELVRVRVHALGASLSTRALEKRRARDWAIYVSLRRSGLLKGDLDARFRATFYYNQAKDALFHFDRPFRRDLARCLATGKAPTKALVMAALAWMPAPLLRRTLEGLLALRNPD